jgi:electron transfer flavoprotein alpha subunit
MHGNDVLLVCEFGPGQSESGNARVVSIGSRLARVWRGRTIALVAGPAAREGAERIGDRVDEVWCAESGDASYSSVHHWAALRTLAESVKPRAILFGHTFVGMDLAPRIAARIKAAAVANAFEVETEGERLRLRRPVHRGKLVETVAVESYPVVVTVQPGGDPLGPPSGPGRVKVLTVAPEPDSKVRHVRILPPAQSEVDITKSEILVAGGRGVGERETFALVTDLAEALGADFACSRPLVDMGWFGVNRQVGLSGNTVKPKLYVACGISGATEHLHGMKEATTIVAINSDSAAPIFKVAHVGIVGDLKEVLPAFASEVRRR